MTASDSRVPPPRVDRPGTLFVTSPHAPKDPRRDALNLLDDPLIRVGGSTLATLPDLCARIARADAVPSFPALRPHQRHAWHAFLVQLSVLALERAGVEAERMPHDAGAWRDLLRGLTPEHPADEPWRLVVDDIMVPAFMQPPAPSAAGEDEYRQRTDTPDDIDILVASRHHSIKGGVARQAAPDDWLFALLTLQTMGGFGGRGLYGIARMNRGNSSRPAFSLVPAGADFGACVRRDIVALAGQLAALRAGSPFRGDAALLWIDPWGGAKSEALPPGRVHALAIEICRRIRLRDGGDGLFAIRASSDAPRIAAADLRGLTGDPWTPTATDKALTVSLGAAFQYDHISTLLGSGDWRLPLLCRPTPAEARSGTSMRLAARAVIRGQGRTDGYRDRVIPLRAAAVRALGVADRDDGIGAIARERVVQVRKVQAALRSALYTFIASGADGPTANFEHVRAWQNRLDEMIEDSFFDALQTEFEAADSDRSAARNAWLRSVVDDATAIFRDAMSALPHHAARRYRARAQAERRFRQRLRDPKSGIPTLYEREADEEHDAA